MRKYIFLLSALLFLSCENPTFTEIDLPPTDPPPITVGTVYTHASYDGSILTLYDGETWTYAESGTVHNAGSGWITVYDVAYHINSETSYRLNCTPDNILFDGSDFYYTYGGTVYKNRDEINDFGLVPADDIRIFKTGIYILQDRYWKNVLTGESYFYTLGDNVATVLDNEITIIGDGTYDYIGYTQSALQWYKFGGQYYSDNGSLYIPSGGIYNNATTLSAFNSGGDLFDMWATAGVLYCIGDYEDNLIWLNLTDGKVYEYFPELNTLTNTGTIFPGYGDYTTARNEKKDMWSIQENGIFLIPIAGDVVEYNHETGSVNIFLSGNKLVFKL